MEKTEEDNKRKNKFCPYCGKKTVHVHIKINTKRRDKSKSVWRCENCFSFI